MMKSIFNILRNYMAVTTIFHFNLKMNIEKIEKLKADLHDKNQYNIQLKNLEQALNDELVLKIVNTDIKFNLQQQKEEATFQSQNQIIILQRFSQKNYQQWK